MKTSIIIILYFISIACIPINTLFAYEIVAVSSLTGRFATLSQKYDKYIVDGVRNAVNEQNKRGGINGRKIKFFFYDDEGRTDKARQIAKLIVKKHPNILGIVGHSLASTTLAALPIYSTYNIPIIVPISQETKITEKGYSNVFRFAGRYDWMVKYLVVVAVKKLNKKNFAIIYPENEKQYYYYFSEALPNDAKIVFESPLNESAIQIASKRLKKLGGNSGLVIFYPFSMIAPEKERLSKMKTIFRDAYTINNRIQLFLTTYEYNDIHIFRKLSKEVGVHNYIITSVGAADYPSGREFIKRYGIKNNYGFFSYICGQIFFQAIMQSQASNAFHPIKLASLGKNKYGNAELQKINYNYDTTFLRTSQAYTVAVAKPLTTTLKQNRFKTGVGEIKFNSKGDALWAPYAMYNVSSGELEILAFDGTGGGGNGCCEYYDFCCDTIN